MSSKISILSVNYSTEFAQIHIHGSRYSCPIKNVNGEWFFRFKNDWHPVNEFTDEYTIYFK